MISNFNHQHALAEEFHIRDIKVIKANYEAALKIKRWKLIQTIPSLSLRLKSEANLIIQDSFLSYIDNCMILLEEGFYSEMLTN